MLLGIYRKQRLRSECVQAFPMLQQPSLLAISNTQLVGTVFVCLSHTVCSGAPWPDDALPTWQQHWQNRRNRQTGHPRPTEVPHTAWELHRERRRLPTVHHLPPTATTDHRFQRCDQVRPCHCIHLADNDCPSSQKEK